MSSAALRLDYLSTTDISKVQLMILECTTLPAGSTSGGITQYMYFVGTGQNCTINTIARYSGDN